MLSQTIDQTYPHLSPALEGVEKFSATIGKRDEEVEHLSPGQQGGRRPR